MPLPHLGLLGSNARNRTDNNNNCPPEPECRVVVIKSDQAEVWVKGEAAGIEEEFVSLVQECIEHNKRRAAGTLPPPGALPMQA